MSSDGDVLQALLELDPAAVVITDAGGRITRVNPAFERLLRYGFGEAEGLELHALRCNRTRVFLPGRARANLRRKDGEVISAETDTSSMTDAGGAVTGYVTRIVDMTVDARLHETLLAAARIAGGQGLSMQDRIDQLLQVGKRHFGLDIGIVSRIEGDVYTVEYVHCPGGAIRAGQEFAVGETFCVHVFAADGPLAIHHAGHSEVATHPCYRATRLEAYVGAPLIVRGARIGTVNFSSPEPRPAPFRVNDLLVASFLSQLVGQALEDDARSDGDTSGDVAGERLYRELYRRSPAMLLATDEEGRLVEVSEAWLARLRYERHEVIHRPHRDFLTEESRRRADAAAGAFWDTGACHAEPYTFVCKDGEIFEGSLSGAVNGEGGRARRGLFVIEDLAQHRRDLIERNQALRDAHEELQQFAYVASHDLRSPLRGISALVQLIVADLGRVPARIPEELMSKLSRVMSRTRLMDVFLDDLLEYSRASRTVHPIEDVDTLALANEVVDHASPPPGLTVTVEGRLPRMRTARAPLRQVLSNLLSNALTHHDRTEGRVIIRGAWQGELASFEVEDDGPGIPEIHHERIFELFQTLRPREEMTASGVGLALVRRLVTRHGGTVRVESRNGERGTTITFTWEGKRLL